MAIKYISNNVPFIKQTASKNEYITTLPDYLIISTSNKQKKTVKFQNIL